MNDEIKEILDNIKPKYDIVDELGNDYKKVKFKDCKLILDYITNLQNEKEDYKSRVEKAAGYMKKNVEILIFEDGTEIYQVKNGNKFYEELLDILEKNNATTNKDL